MIKFEVGKSYSAKSVCDHNCVFSIEVTKRSSKMITYIYNGTEKRSKVREFEGNECVIPDNYSMAPIFRAA